MKSVGREEELRLLRQAFDGPGGMLLVSGEGGVGKSCLAQDAATIATEDKRFVIWARPEQVANPGPFALMLDLVENIAARYPKASTEASALGKDLLASNQGGDSHAPRRVAAQLRGLLAQVGDRSLTIFEDLHAADEASHAAIVHLARSARDDSRAILATYRSDEVGLVDELSKFLDVVSSEKLAETIALSPLDREAAIALAESKLPPAAAGQAQWIAAQSEGIPFFIEELAAAFARTGPGGGIPTTIARAALVRRQQLGALAKHVLAAAAIASGPIDVDVLARACELDPGTVARALSEAVRAGIIEDREDRLSFRHALVREAIVADLVSVEAQQWHRTIASAIEHVHAAQLPAHARSLAHHWYEGRDKARAFAYALQAGNRGLTLAATSEARSSFELALACVEEPSGHALLGLAETEVREGSTVAAAALFERAIAAFSSSDDLDGVAKAKVRLAWVHAANFEPEKAAAQLDEAIEMLRPRGESPLLARVLTQRGRLWKSGDDPQPPLQEAVEISQRFGEHSIRADALDGLAVVAYQGGDVSVAVSLTEQACAAALLGSEAESIGRTHNNGAIILESAGRPLDAIDKLGVARASLTQTFGPLGIAFLDNTEAGIQYMMGQPDRVLRLLVRHDVSYSVVLETSLSLLAWGSVHAGDDARAAALVRRARESHGVAVSVPGVEVEGAEGLIAIALVAITAGAAPSEELLAVARALLELDVSAEINDQMRAVSLGTRLLAQQKQIREVQEGLARMKDLLANYPSLYFAGVTSETEASVHGAREERERCLRQAIETFTAYPNVVDRARCMRLLANEIADKEEAIGLLREALALASACGSVLESARSEAALRGLGVRPRAGRPRKSEDSNALSRREEEITALVGAGASNAHIAARLFLSERTVQDHISHALRKLSLSGRAALAAWAAKNGLV